MKNPAVTIRKLTIAYHRQPAIHDVDVKLARGSLTAVIGPNGAGKTTLLRGIAGELKPSSGSIDLGPTVRVAYMPQYRNVDLKVPISVVDMVAMGLWHTIGMFNPIGKSYQDKIAHALTAVGLPANDQRQFGRLSGGEMQRVLFARLILQDADLILLDEPFRAIDSDTISDLVDLLSEWCSEGRTILASLHDMDLVRERFREAMLISRKLIQHGVSSAVATRSNLERARDICISLDDAAKSFRRGHSGVSA